MARKIDLNGAAKAKATHVAGKANTFKVTLPKGGKQAQKAAPKPRKARIEYRFNQSMVYGALKYLAEGDLLRERDADFGSGLASSIVSGQTSERRFFFAKKICLKREHREALVQAGFDLGELMQETFVAPKRTAADYVTVTGVYGGMSESGAAFRFKSGGRRHWIPVSQCQFGKTGLPDEEGEQATFKLAKWLVEKNNIQAAG